MATRSHIYIETDDGYIGCYSHYDGSPSTKVPSLVSRSYEDVYGIILKATTCGGISSFEDNYRYIPDRVELGEIKYINDAPTEILFHPKSSDESRHVDYVYIKEKDGSVSYALGQDVTIEGYWHHYMSAKDFFDRTWEIYK